MDPDRRRRVLSDPPAPAGPEAGQPDFTRFLLSGPYVDELEIDRSTEPARVVDLDDGG